MGRRATGNEQRDLRHLEARLGYHFKDKKWLERATIHSSARARQDVDRDNERLEFLGDRVLGLSVAEMLIRKYPDANEGELARTFNSLVRKETCAEIAQDLELGKYLLLGGGEQKGGGRRKQTILGDACEALLGAIFLDGGFEPAGDVIRQLWHSRMSETVETQADPKTALQEWAQSRGLSLPKYDDVDRKGPDHKPIFTTAVRIKGLSAHEGEGESKRAAQQAAAEAVLIREGVWTGKGTNG